MNHVAGLPTHPLSNLVCLLTTFFFFSRFSNPSDDFLSDASFVLFSQITGFLLFFFTIGLRLIPNADGNGLALCRFPPFYLDVSADSPSKLLTCPSHRVITMRNFYRRLVTFHSSFASNKARIEDFFFFSFSDVPFSIPEVI